MSKKIDTGTESIASVGGVLNFAEAGEVTGAIGVTNHPLTAIEKIASDKASNTDPTEGLLAIQFLSNDILANPTVRENTVGTVAASVLITSTVIDIFYGIRDNLFTLQGDVSLSNGSIIYSAESTLTGNVTVTGTAGTADTGTEY